MLTEKEAYEAMLHMLKSYWKLSGSNDLTDILSAGEYLNDGSPADSAMWEYWKEAIDLFKDKEGNILIKPKNGSGPGELTGYNINDF